MMVKTAIAPVVAACLLFTAACGNAQHAAGAAFDQVNESEMAKKVPVPTPPQCEKPSYPKSSLMRGEEGTVHLSYLISVNGYVKDSKVVRSSGYVDLDERARTSIAKCKFKPKQLDGVAVEAWRPVVYTWSIG